MSMALSNRTPAAAAAAALAVNERSLVVARARLGALEADMRVGEGVLQQLRVRCQQVAAAGAAAGAAPGAPGSRLHCLKRVVELSAQLVQVRKGLAVLRSELQRWVLQLEMLK